MNHLLPPISAINESIEHGKYVSLIHALKVIVLDKNLSDTLATADHEAFIRCVEAVYPYLTNEEIGREFSPAAYFAINACMKRDYDAADYLREKVDYLIKNGIDEILNENPNANWAMAVHQNKEEIDKLNREIKRLERKS